MAQIRIKGSEAQQDETLRVLASNYPNEIKGIDKVEQKGQEVHTHTTHPTRGHRADRYIRVTEAFNVEDLKELVKTLQQFQPNYIKDLMQTNFNKSIRQLRHELADSQLMYGLTQVSRALGHNSKKNAVYYIDFLKVAEESGEDKALELIAKSDQAQQFNLMRLAVRIELEIFRQTTQA